VALIKSGDKEIRVGSGFVVDFDDGGASDIVYREDGSQEYVDKDSAKRPVRVFLLTSAANVAGVAPSKIKIALPSDPDTELPAVLVETDEGRGLALLRVDFPSSTDKYKSFQPPPPPPLVLSDEGIDTHMMGAGAEGSEPSSPNEIGSPVFALGYSGNGSGGPTMTSGIIAAVVSESKGKGGDKSSSSFVVSDAAVAEGMSGGPLVDIDGIVLGVGVDAPSSEQQKLGNYAVSAEECEVFLAGAEGRCAARAAEAFGMIGDEDDGGGGRGGSRGRGRGRGSIDKEEEIEKVETTLIASKRQRTRSSSESEEAAAPSSSPSPIKHDNEKGVAGYRVMLYSDPLMQSKRAQIASILSRVAKLDETRAENTMLAAGALGAGMVTEFLVVEAEEEEDCVSSKTARANAERLCRLLSGEELRAEVEPIVLLE